MIDQRSPQSSAAGTGELALDQARVYRVGDLCPNVLPFSRVTLWRMIGRGEFPEPVHLSPRARGWTGATVVNWLRQRGSR